MDIYPNKIGYILEIILIITMEKFDLKRFRINNKITQKELAELLNCNQNFISRIESGIRQLPQSKLDVLKEKFGNISQYFTEELPTDKKSETDKSVTIESLQQEITFLQERLSEEKARSEKYLDMLQSLIKK